MSAVPDEDERRAILARRRERFGADLGARPLLVLAGRAPARNYEANRYPFRASSHFLHFVGEPREGAALLLGDGGATLFAPIPDADDALWHGPSESIDALGRRLGLAVRPLDELEDAIARMRPVALASHDGSIRDELARLGVPTLDGDARLAIVDALVRARLVHDAFAIAELERAAAITTRAHLAGMAATRAGISAAVPRAMMESVFIAAGATTAYGSIVTPHGEVLHAGPTTRTLAHGDLLLCDVGAEVATGYASDVTRTYPVSGIFEPDARAIYEVVLRAQREAIGAATPGARYRDVHLVAMRAIARGLVDLGLVLGDVDERVADGTIARFFPHGVGHLLGLDVHDMEDLGDRAGYAPGRVRSTEPGLRYLRLDRELEVGMAFTIEPGLYFVPGLLDPAETRREFAGRIDFAIVDRFRAVRGIRIEDDVLLTSGGARILTRAIPKTVADLESIVGSGGDLSVLIDIDGGPALASGPDRSP